MIAISIWGHSMTNEYSKTYNAVLCMLLQEASHLSAANGVVLEVKEGEHLHYLSTYGILEPLLDYKIPIKGSFSGKCLIEKKAQACEDIKNNPIASVSKMAFADLDVNSMVVIPVFDKEKNVKAVLKLTSEDTHFFNENHAKEIEGFLEPITKSIAAAMTDAEKHAEYNQKKFDKLATKKLKKFQRDMFADDDADELLLIFDALAECIHQGVLVTDAQGAVVYTNSAYQKIIDLTEDEVLKDGWMKNIHEDDLATTKKSWSNTINLQTTFAIQYRIYNKTGVIKTCKTTSAPLLKNNKIFGHLGILEEVPNQV